MTSAPEGQPNDGSDADHVSPEGLHPGPRARPLRMPAPSVHLRYEYDARRPVGFNPRAPSIVQEEVTANPVPPAPTPASSVSEGIDGGDRPPVFKPVVAPWPSTHAIDMIDIGLNGTLMVRNAAPDTAPPAPLTTRLVIWEINHPNNNAPNFDDGWSMSSDSVREPFSLGGENWRRFAEHPIPGPVSISPRDRTIRPFAVRDLQRLWMHDPWDDGSMVRPFAVQTNLIGPAKNPMRNTPAMTSWKELKSGLPTISILECVSTVYSDLSPDHSIITFTFDGIRFQREKEKRRSWSPDPDVENAPRPSSDSRPAARIESFSLLRNLFLSLLLSSRAASAVEHRDLNTGVQLVTLDLLRAVIHCWEDFVTTLGRDADRYAELMDSRSRIDNVRIWQDLQAAPRDIKIATDRLIGSAVLHLPETSKARLEDIRLEMDARIRAVENGIADIMRYSSDLVSARITLGQEEQAVSVNRLTLLAAIFLPLSLASSLLSMGTRALDLGVLWYDYLGISVFLVFFAMLVYQGLRAWGRLRAQWAPARGGSPFYGFLQRNRFLRDLFLRETAIRFARREQRDPKAPRGPGLMRRALKGIWGLLLTGVKSYVTWNYALGLAIVASFAVGMFHDLGLGSRILGYAFVGWMIMLMVPTAVRLQGILWHLMFAVAREILFKARGGQFSGTGRGGGA